MEKLLHFLICYQSCSKYVSGTLPHSTLTTTPQYYTAVLPLSQTKFMIHSWDSQKVKFDMTTNTIVMELGGSLLRIGFAGESVPRFILPSNMFPTVIKSPGKIRQKCTEIFHSLFLQQLQVKSKDCRVLVIEKFYTPRILRNSLLTSLLKDLQVRAWMELEG